MTTMYERAASESMGDYNGGIAGGKFVAGLKEKWGKVPPLGKWIGYAIIGIIVLCILAWILGLAFGSESFRGLGTFVNMRNGMNTNPAMGIDHAAYDAGAYDVGNPANSMNLGLALPGGESMHSN